MDVAALRNQIEADIAAGDRPCLVVGTAGSVSTGAVDPPFRESINTFRRMSVSEMQQTRPLRLKLAEVQHGDTVDRLARRMAVSDRYVERFRVLNGLGPNDKVKPGDRVKMVVE